MRADRKAYLAIGIANAATNGSYLFSESGSNMSENGFAKRLTAEDLIVIGDSHDRWKRRFGWLCFVCGAGFGAAVMALILSLYGKL